MGAMEMVTLSLFGFFNESMLAQLKQGIARLINRMKRYKHFVNGKYSLEALIKLDKMLTDIWLLPSPAKSKSVF